jgi:hypothetical protein
MSGLQNRVTPLGELIAVPARGLVYGNRGCLHDAQGRIRRSHAVRRWIACRLQFRGWQRAPLMQPGRFTELFFLDEATALAAGHRPCGECRRADYRRFKRAWFAGNPERGLAGSAPIGAIDRELHRDRLTSDGRQRTFRADIETLPDGVFVGREDPATPLLIWRGALWPWSPEGYGDPETKPDADLVTVLTPRSTVRALAAGYTPDVDASAQKEGDRMP